MADNNRKRNYIGLACSLHDPALAIVDSRGEVRFAEATERHLQEKRAFGAAPDTFFRIPDLIAEYCEPDADLVVARSWSQQFQSEQPEQLQRNVRRLEAARQRLQRWPWVKRRFFGDVDSEHLDQALGELSAQAKYIGQSIRRYATTGASIEYQCRNLFLGIDRQVEFVDCEHHEAHAWYACLASPFDDALCIVIDGEGEGRSQAFYRYENGRVSELPVERSRHETGLGVLYTFLTEICGFDSWRGEEWKLMGLASYGTPREDYEQMLREIIGVDGVLTVNPTRSQTASLAGFVKFLEMRRRDEPALEYADLARTMQKVFGDLTLELLTNLQQQFGGEKLVYTGGCALNSAFNGKIVEHTQFEEVYIPSAPADDGNALGAALMAFHQDHETAQAKRPGASPFLGTSMTGRGLSRFLEFSELEVVNLDEEAMCRRVAEALADGHIVGWVQGRAEYGPRALGNRSILADPRSPEVKDRINARVKFREEFRPFAPSILAEHGAEYFECFQPSPYMERTLRFRDEVIERVPGVVHIDQTGRLQTVTEEGNAKYHRLITCFYELTGIPLLLNTSFNVMGKPIAHTVQDAISVFYTSGLDLLVIEDYMIAKSRLTSRQDDAPAEVALSAASQS
ncbi:MAG: carbamoyltransferase C-terminal domain-containing protein [Acidobacteriota bacterium]